MSDDNEQDDDQKTEEPSERRLEQAQEKGQVPVSKEIVNWFFILTSAVIMIGIAPYIAKKLVNIFLPFVIAPEQFLMDPNALQRLAQHITWSVAPLVALPLCVMFIVLIGIGVLQVGKGFAVASLKPKMSRLSPKQGIKKIFSVQAIVEFIKVLLKTAVLCVSIYLIFKNHVYDIKNWTHLTMQQMMLIFEQLLLKLFALVLVILFFLGIGDYLYQRYQHHKKLRMTKQEVKEEFKDIEGDPVIKQRIRQLRADRSRNRMMQDVETATVVVTNPTHFSVALAWDPETMSAPRVVAKGQDFIALKIREIAKNKNIPVIENPPVARALFSRVDLNQEIPPDYYKAVADIIRLVTKLKGQQF